MLDNSATAKMRHANVFAFSMYAHVCKEKRDVIKY